MLTRRWPGHNRAFTGLRRIPYRLRSLLRWLARHPQVLLIFVLLLAFGLRLYRLGTKDVWWSEASSAYQAPTQTGERLPVRDGQAEPSGDHIILRYVFIEAE